MLRKIQSNLKPPKLRGISLNLFSEHSRFRNRLAAIVYSGWAEGLSIALILTHLLLVVVLDGRFEIIRAILNIVFFLLFSIEIICKIISLGFVKGEGTFLRDAWNKLDFVALFCSLISLPASQAAITFTVLRAARVFRIIRHAAGLRALMSYVGHTTKLLSKSLGLLLFCFALFAIVGSQFFAGELQGDDHNLAGLTGFNHFPQALLTVFIITTTDDWSAYMLGLSQSGAWVFYVTLHLLVTFTVIGMFVAVIANTFAHRRAQDRAPRDDDSASFNTSFVRSESIEVSMMLTPAQSFCDRIQSRRAFQTIRLCAVVLNAVSMTIRFASMPFALAVVVELVQLVATAQFVVEMVIRWVATGWRGLKKRNPIATVFDTLLVASTAIMTLVAYLTGGCWTALYVLRALRLMSLLHASKTLTTIVQRVFYNTSSILQVLLFTLIFWMLAAVLGMQIFSRRMTDLSDPTSAGLSPALNFDSLGMSLVCVFVVMMGDGWSELMRNAQHGPAAWVAVVYFPLVYVLARYIVLNMFMAVLLENFDIPEEEREKKQESEFQHVIEDAFETEMKVANKEPAVVTMRRKMSSQMLRKKRSNRRLLSVITNSPSNMSPTSSGASTPRTPVSPGTMAAVFGRGFVSSENTPPESVIKVVADTPPVSPKPVLPGMHMRRRPSGLRFDWDAVNTSVMSAPQSNESTPPVSPPTGRASYTPFFDFGITATATNATATTSTAAVTTAVTATVTTSATATVTAPVTAGRSSESATPPCSPPLGPLSAADAPSLLVRSSSLGSMHSALSADVARAVIARTTKHVSRRRHRFTKFVSRLAGNNPNPLLFSEEWNEYNCADGGGNNSSISDASFAQYTLLDKARNWLNNYGSDFFMLLAIVLSNAALLVVRVNASWQQVLVLMLTDMITAAVFLVDAAMQIQRFTARVYLRNPWHAADFVVTLSCVVVLFWHPVSMVSQSDTVLITSKYLFTLRCLRPIRLISFVPGMRDVVSAVGRSLRAIGRVLLLFGVIFATFAIASVYLFGGQLASCNDAAVTTMSECVGSYLVEGYEAPRVWSYSTSGFDNFGQACATLFMVASLQQWAPIMQSTMDIVGQNMQPQMNASPWNAVFFIAFCLCVGFFLMTVFVGLLAEQYTQVSGMAMLTREQRLWAELQRMFAQMAPTRAPPVLQSAFRLKVRAFMSKRAVQMCMNALVVANCVTLVVAYYQNPYALSMTIDVVNIVLAVACTLEVLAKLVAFSPMYYLSSSVWNVLEAVSATGSLVGVCLMSTTVVVLKVFRIVRVLRMIQIVPGLGELFETLMRSLRIVVHILLVLLVVILVYSVLGVQVWGAVRLGDNVTGDLNFRDVPTAMLLLFIASTGENWNLYMQDMQIDVPLCSTNGALNDCGNYYGALVFFFTFVIASTYVLINLLMAALISNLTQLYYSEAFEIKARHMKQFCSRWGEFSDNHFMPLRKVQAFVSSLQGPLGIDDTLAGMVTLRREAAMKADKQHGIPFVRLLRMLALRRLGQSYLRLGDRALRQEQESRLRSETFSQLVRAAMAIQRWHRKLKQRRTLQVIRSRSCTPIPASLSAKVSLSPSARPRSISCDTSNIDTVLELTSIRMAPAALSVSANASANLLMTPSPTRIEITPPPPSSAHSVSLMTARQVRHSAKLSLTPSSLSTNLSLSDQTTNGSSAQESLRYQRADRRQITLLGLMNGVHELGEASLSSIDIQVTQLDSTPSMLDTATIQLDELDDTQNDSQSALDTAVLEDSTVAADAEVQMALQHLHDTGFIHADQSHVLLMEDSDLDMSFDTATSASLVG
eukprot:TRINITY_DN2412_c0_g2_i4.p1 TRINITY_DN2412_c0_g2~~TRINITY_DN2412_c0_g2_i4.p1  ORF type:complete len:1803 (-),score=442.35 TRINITY_DN2412_c0_g2_i4:29-5437(-)